MSYSIKKLHRGTLPCFSKILVSKSFIDKSGGREYHDFPSKLFCLTVPRIFVGEPFSVSLISGIEKFYAYAGFFTIFYKNLLSHSTEKLRRVTLLCFTNFLVSEKLWIRGEDRGSITIFRQKSFVTVPKIFVGEPLSALIIYGIEKFHSYEWNITNFFGNVLSHSTEKNLLGNPSVFHKVSGVEKIDG